MYKSTIIYLLKLVGYAIISVNDAQVYARQEQKGRERDGRAYQIFCGKTEGGI